MPLYLKGKTHLLPAVGPFTVVQVEEVDGVVEDCWDRQAGLQSPQLPFTWFPKISVAVEHHGLSNPPSVVQEV